MERAADRDIFRSLILLGEGGGESSFVLRSSDKQFNLLKSSSDLSSGKRTLHRLWGALSPPGVSVMACGKHAAQAYPGPWLTVLALLLPFLSWEMLRFRGDQQHAQHPSLVSTRTRNLPQVGWAGPTQIERFNCKKH